jgi:hypothetical protein
MVELVVKDVGVVDGLYNSSSALEASDASGSGSVDVPKESV